MSKQNRIVVIGGSACGPKAAARARRCDQHAMITMVEQGERLSVATCGLPYYVSGVIESRDELLQRQPDFFRDVLDIDVRTKTSATAINREAHTIELLSLETNKVSTMEYDKLVLSTGSTPATPPLQGRGLKGIFTLTKIDDADAIRSVLAQRKSKKATIIGAGLIGQEMAENLVALGLEVTIIELFDRVMPALLDFEISAYLEKHLKANGVNLLLNQRVTGFDGDNDGWVNKVVMESGQVETDMVLLALGARPNTTLAQECGLNIGPTRGIAVNEYLQTSDPDIYAGGDCVENMNLITKQKMLAALGSIANKHGRAIGSNVTGGRETFPGILGTAIAKVFEYNVARVGLNESQAREAGYDVVTSLVPGYEHATYYPCGKEILVKLIAEKSTGKLLGGQVIGPGETGKRIDVLVTALTFGATVNDLANLDLAYAPPFSNALDPLHNAANVIRNKLSGYARSLTPMEVHDKIQVGDKFTLLDVRLPDEWEEKCIPATQARLIPLRELRSRLNELDRAVEIVTLCYASVRAYQAQRILDGAGLLDVKFMDGSIAAWPYEISSTEAESAQGV